MLGAAIAAALFHALAIVLLLVLPAPKPNPAERKHLPTGVALRPLSAEAFAKNRGDNPPPRPLAPQARKQDEKKPDKPKPKEDLPSGQVVATPKGNEQVDPAAKYLAESNNVAPKETRAKETTAFYKNAMARRTAPKAIAGDGIDEVDRAIRGGNEGLGDDEKPLQETRPSAPAFELPDVKAKPEIALREAPSGPGISLANRLETEEIRGNSTRLNVQLGSFGEQAPSSEGRVGAAGGLNLTPSQAVVDSIVGAAANDHLKDVAEGEATYLSTKEWKYATFFNRVKQSVGQQWHPAPQMRQRDPSLQQFGTKDRYTVLAVVLDAHGRLKDAYVEKSSGLDFLDVEAIRAFERAQPFPNPPPGLLADDQTVRFQFGFMLELSGQPGMHLFRYND